MNRSSIPTPTKTHTPDARNTARRTTPAQFGRTLACWWDKVTVVGLLASCGAYGLYSITQMTGF